MKLEFLGMPAELRPHFSESLLSDVERHLPIDHSIGYRKVHEAMSTWSPFTVRNALRELERLGRVHSRVVTGKHGDLRRVYRRAGAEAAP